MPARRIAHGCRRATIAGSALACAVVMAGAAQAQASTVFTESLGATIVVDAAAGETNSISFNDQGSYTIQDLNGTALDVQSPCTRTIDPMIVGTLAVCPLTGVTRARVALADGNDYFFAGAISTIRIHLELDGGPGNDEITAGAVADVLVGGPGEDRLVGGDGRDAIDAFDGEADDVLCGSGDDIAYADAIDDVNADCETVTRAAAPPLVCPAGTVGVPGTCVTPLPPTCAAGETGVPPHCAAAVPAAGPRIPKLLLRSARRVRVDRRGRVSLGSLRCPVTASCSAASARLESPACIRCEPRGLHAQRSFDVAPGQRVDLRLTLRPRALRALRRHGRLKVRLVVQRDGQAPDRRTVMLLAPRRSIAAG